MHVLSGLRTKSNFQPVTVEESGRMRLRRRVMFSGLALMAFTTVLSVVGFFSVVEVDVRVGAGFERLQSLHKSLKKTLQNTNLLDGINLLKGADDLNDIEHENASAFDEWTFINKGQKQPWKPRSAKRVKSQNGSQLKPWQQFHADITQDQMYSRNAPYMNRLLLDLATSPVDTVGMYHGGSQLKLSVKLGDGNYAMVKPMRSPRNYVYGYNEQQPFWLDQERHNAEVAAFHLDRILDFRRAPPCAGRIINMTRDIVEKTTDRDLLSSFYKQGKNTCFIGKCAPWFCNKEHPVCGRGDMLEVSMCQFLPFYNGQEPIADKPYPWSQGVREAKIWKNQNICEDLLQNPANAEGRFFLDLIEQAIFDFLIRNYDRHHFHLMKQYGAKSFVVALDNGKGFGNPYEDDLSFLAPIAQCCIMRKSTYKYLLKMSKSPRERLSDHMRTTLLKDKISPVIPETYLESLDRRLDKVIKMVQDCINLHGERRVLVNKLTLPMQDGTRKTET